MEPGALASTVLHQLGAAGDEIVEQDRVGIGLGRGVGPHGASVVSEDEGIDGVGLGELTTGAGKVADEPGIDHANEDDRLVQSMDESPMIGPGRLADDMDGRGALGEDFKQQAKTGRSIGDGGGDSKKGATQFDGIFGNISTDVDRVSNHGKTYPCEYELEPDGLVSRTAGFRQLFKFKPKAAAG